MRAAGADDEQIVRVVRAAADSMRVALPALHPFPLMPEVLGELAEARHLVVVTSNTEDRRAGLLAPARHQAAWRRSPGRRRGRARWTRSTDSWRAFPVRSSTGSWATRPGTCAKRGSPAPRRSASPGAGTSRTELEEAGAERIAQTPADLLAIVAPELSADFLGSG